MSVSSIRPACCLPGRPWPRPAVSLQADGAPQPVRIRTGATPTQRELRQKLLETLLAGANANKVRDIAISRPDLMEAASADQRSRMARTLLDRVFFGSADRQAILATLKPALVLGELPPTLAAIATAEKLGSLFKQMGAEDEGLELARLNLAGGVYNDLVVTSLLGTTGVRALVRVATDEHLDGLTREAKLTMIGILQSGPQDDETEVILRRLRRHLH